MRLRAEPPRLHKQLESVNIARVAVDDEVAQLRSSVASHEDALRSHSQALYSVKKARRGLDAQLRAQRGETAAAAEEVDGLESQLGAARGAHKLLAEARLERRGELELASSAARASEARREAAAGTYGRALRELQRAEGRANDAAARIPPLEASLSQSRSELDSLRREVDESLDSELKAVRVDIESLHSRMARSESTDRAAHAALSAAHAEVAHLEATRDAWAREQLVAVKHIAALKAGRDLKVREAERLGEARAATLDQCRAKELSLVDSSKKLADLGAALQGLTRLYESATSEKAGYASAVAAVGQTAGEMRERIKILTNEVAILSHESVAKERALGREAQAHALSQSQRDLLRVEVNRVAATYKERQAAVESHIQVIDKLNSIINGLERDMVGLRRQYEGAVEGRNYAGIALIDRNDELVILYEKANVHAHTLVRGEGALAVVRGELRMLRIEAADVERQVALAQRRLPEVPALAERITELQAELGRARGQTEALCLELERSNGPGVQRWRLLGGDDPDSESLTAAITALEHRLDLSRSESLDRDLLAEELGERIARVRHELEVAEAMGAVIGGGSGSGGGYGDHPDADGATAAADLARRGVIAGESALDAPALALARQASVLQGRLAEAGKKVASLVAELAMYHATAAKLAEEAAEGQGVLDDAQAAFARGEAPTAAAEVKWRAMQRTTAAATRPRRASGTATGASTAGASLGLGSAMTTTTSGRDRRRSSSHGATVRPNAYIPGGDELPVPKPYPAAFAPFAPSELVGPARFYGHGTGGPDREAAEAAGAVDDHDHDVDWAYAFLELK